MVNICKHKQNKTHCQKTKHHSQRNLVPYNHVHLHVYIYKGSQWNDKGYSNKGGETGKLCNIVWGKMDRQGKTVNYDKINHYKGKMVISYTLQLMDQKEA